MRQKGLLISLKSTGNEKLVKTAFFFLVALQGNDVYGLA